jgi:hypothetical protein
VHRIKSRSPRCGTPKCGSPCASPTCGVRAGVRSSPHAVTVLRQGQPTRCRSTEIRISW